MRCSKNGSPTSSVPSRGPGWAQLPVLVLAWRFSRPLGNCVSSALGQAPGIFKSQEFTESSGEVLAHQDTPASAWTNEDCKGAGIAWHNMDQFWSGSFGRSSVAGRTRLPLEISARQHRTNSLVPPKLSQTTHATKSPERHLHRRARIGRPHLVANHREETARCVRCRRRCLP